MKKVLFVATITRTINAFLIPYLKMFKEKGYEVHVASNGDEQIEYCDKHFNIQFARFPIKPSNLKAYKELKKIINENDYEIIHCHTPVAGVLTRLAARKARKNGSKVFYTAHGFHFYKGASLLNWIIYYPIEKICAKWTDCLITINKEDYDLAKKKLKAKQIEYVHGVGMDTSRFEKELTNEEKLEFRKSLGIKEDDIVFSYVAELNKNKNQILLINTIKELKKNKENIKLLLVGTGPLHNYYKEIIQKNSLNDSIKLLGRRQDINEILSITDIYLASSLREGLPVNIMEAMYKGLPIIATDNRGHRELIKDEENGFIAKNIENFCRIIGKIINNEQDLCKKIGNNNTIKIKNEYVIDKILEKINAIYVLNPKIPKIIHYVWMGRKEKPKEIIQCMNSWKKLKGYQFIEWNEDNFDINSNEFVKKAYKNKKWAFVSDYVRAWAIYNYGGIYFDTDILLIDPKRFDYLLLNDSFIGYESNLMPFTAVFGAKKNSIFVKDMLLHYEENDNDLNTTNTKWVTDILINNYGCKLGNKEQMLKDNLKLYKKEILCEPSKKSVTVHAFTSTWVEKKSLFGKICTYLRTHANKKLYRILYSKIIVPIKEKKNERVFNNNNTNI